MKAQNINPLDVYKKLPRTNCGKCSVGTCMAFAVQFFQKMITSDECPELDEQSKKEINAMLPQAGNWKEKRLRELFQEISSINFSHIAEGIGAVNKDNNVLELKYMGKEVVVSVGNNQNEAKNNNDCLP
jgi:Na+-translocating ferredoxin:NAD+ oxidoreductase RNF subunit RnfB